MNSATFGRLFSETTPSLLDIYMLFIDYSVAYFTVEQMLTHE